MTDANLHMNAAPSADAHVPLEAFKKVFTLNKLILESGQLKTRQELIFYILNHSIEYCHYDRAYLWECTSSVKNIGVSGCVEAGSKSNQLCDLSNVVASLKEPERFQIIGADSLNKIPEEWNGIDSDQALAWCPIVRDNVVVAGLLLARWEQRCWHESDLNLMQSLCCGYSIAWAPHIKKSITLFNIIKRKRALFALSLLAVAMSCYIKLPLRIIAPCEVVPKDPVVISAPLDGVVDTIVVQPGESVGEGSLLFSYDKRIPLEELNVARQQLKVIGSDLERAEALAFSDKEAKGTIALLETRYKQEQIKLRLAEMNSRKLDVTAPGRGVVMMGDPNQWSGRPTAVGEKVMQLIDPYKSKLQIWLPQDDKVEFSEDTPVNVILNAKTSETLKAGLIYQANHAEIAANGISSFLAEADWKEKDCYLQMGLKGTAILYGEKVPLWYWLFRRPLGTIRQKFGL